MATLDPRIEAIRAKYDLGRDDFWELPQKKGTWLAKHSALEAVAVKAKIDFIHPTVIEANSLEKVAVLLVQGTLPPDGSKIRTEWSIGEASPANNKNAYPYAMAEKRGKDRVILKLVGLHGLVYSEEEADDFKANGNGNGSKAGTVTYDDNDGQMRAYIDKQKGFIKVCKTVEDVQGWEEGRADELGRLKRKDLKAWNELRLCKEGRIYEINTDTGEKK